MLVLWKRRVIVPGMAAPKGNHHIVRTKGGEAIIRDSASLGKWLKYALPILRDCAPRAPWRGAVSVHVSDHVPRPASHYIAGNPLKGLKKNAPFVPARGRFPDGDKSERATWDALKKAGWIEDDQRVYNASYERVYLDPCDTGPYKCICVRGVTNNDPDAEGGSAEYNGDFYYGSLQAEALHAGEVAANRSKGARMAALKKTLARQA